MQKFRILLGVVTALASLSACDGTTTTPLLDSGPMIDSGRAPGTDSSVDAPSSGGSGTCAMPINLDTMGTALTTGTGRTITSSNASTPAAVMSDVPNGTCIVDTNGDPTPPDHEVVFSYTVQNGGHVRVSTNNPTSDVMLDSAVWVLDVCAATATELGCNDDDPNVDTLLSTADTSNLSAGTHIFIIVGGFPGDTDTGTFMLTVTELPTNAAGAVCDLVDSPFCAEGSSCQVDAGADTMGHCLADGANNGACRITAPFCDAALACSVDAPSAADPGTCQMPIASGQPCTQDHFVCVPGSTCLPDSGSNTMGHCLADGGEYGLCRVTGTACDASLTCSQMTPTAEDPGTCQMPIAAAGACTTDMHFLCVTGFSCQSTDGATPAGTCVADGVEYGACRTTGTACDAGLTCSATPPTADDTCQMPIAAGGVCTSHHFLCATGDSCVFTTDTMGTCNADGSMGANCRASDPQCDGTLECQFDNTCQAPTP